MSNSLDPDQARRIVGPDLGPNCLPSLSADDTGRQRVNSLTHVICNMSKLTFTSGDGMMVCKTFSIFKALITLLTYIIYCIYLFN